MPGMADQRAAIDSFLTMVRQVHATGQATPERSYYPSISSLLNGLLNSLRPRRRAITDPQGIEREFPDLGVIEVESNVLVLPVEVKPPTVEIKDILASAQALKYARTFGGGLVLVTNIREFAIGRIDQATNALLEEDRVTLAETAGQLHARHTVSNELAASFTGMLDTACQARRSLGNPEDVARLLAFHAGRMRDSVEATGNATDLLEPIHAAMRDGLHIDIEPNLLVPTVVQTLVYGLFASWLESEGSEDLDWMEMAYRLEVPVFADVLHAALRPQLIRECNLKQHLNSAARVLNWVDGSRFVTAFDGDAIQYFYEPFLAAFDPLLRDRLGVWYTPKEIAEYQIARVDRQIRESLGIGAGLADASVYVLDPACGTGTYLASLIRFVYQRHLDNTSRTPWRPPGHAKQQ